MVQSLLPTFASHDNFYIKETIENSNETFKHQVHPEGVIRHLFVSNGLTVTFASDTLHPSVPVVYSSSRCVSHSRDVKEDWNGDDSDDIVTPLCLSHGCCCTC